MATTLTHPRSNTSFRAFLKRHRERQDPVGDFASDWLDDMRTAHNPHAPGGHAPCPTAEDGIEAIVEWLKDIGAIDDAVKAARAAWVEFEQQV